VKATKKTLKKRKRPTRNTPSTTPLTTPLTTTEATVIETKVPATESPETKKVKQMDVEKNSATIEMKKQSEK